MPPFEATRVSITFGVEGEFGQGKEHGDIAAAYRPRPQSRNQERNLLESADNNPIVLSIPAEKTAVKPRSSYLPFLAIAVAIAIPMSSMAFMLTRAAIEDAGRRQGTYIPSQLPSVAFTVH